MKCFNCGYEGNELHAEQCKVCGVKFEHLCDACGKPNPKLAKFCLHCGHELEKQIEVELEETRRPVAVLFADLSGFTKLSEQLDPEEVRDIINGAFQHILRPVYELEGTIDKYIGDCVMVLFGAKQSHRDDAARALRCALEMNRLIAEYSEEKLSKSNTELKLSIGINYGVVVTGQVGNYYDKDYTVIGDVVNTAQRLQVEANAGQILVSESVFLDTQDFTDYLEGKYVELKNKENPVKVYTPVGLRAHITDTSHMIERSEEIQKLGEIFSSDNKFALITGESGLGKSTLVKEFLTNIEDIKKIWVNTNTNIKNKPYGLLSNVILGILNVNVNDSLRIKENRLRSFLDYILSDLEEEDIVRNYNFLALVTGLHLDNEYTTLINAMEYSDLQSEIEFQVNLFFDGYVTKQNTLLVVEDVDYSDEQSLQLLNQLSHTNMMILAIAGSHLESLSNAVVMELKRLDFENTKRMIEKKLNGTVEHDTLLQLFELSHGNPMITNEIIESAKKRNLFYLGDVISLRENALKEIPTTITGLIQNKIDALQKEEVTFLRVASVLGNEFSLGWIRSLIDFDQSIIQTLLNLNILEFKDVLSTNSRDGKVYGFKQKLVRDVIYSNLLTKDKRRLHKEIAIMLSKLDDAESYNIIGQHFEDAAMVSQSTEYYYKYADYMKESFNYNTASEYYNKVLRTKQDSKYSRNALMENIRLFTTLSKFEQAEKLISQKDDYTFSKEDSFEIMVMEIQLLKDQTKLEEATSIVESLESELTEQNQLLGKVLQMKASIYLMMGKPEVIEVAKKSEEILLKSRDYASLADTMSFAGIASFMQGKMEDAVSYLEKGYDYAGLSNNLLSQSKISTNLGIIYHATGEVNKSFKFLQEAIDAALKVGSNKNYLSAALNLGVFYMEKGEFKNADELFNELLHKALAGNFMYHSCIAYTNLGDLSFEYGEYLEAKVHYESALEIAKEHSLLYEEGVGSLSMAKVLYELKQDGSKELEHAYKIFDQTEEIANVADYYYVKAKYASDDKIADYKKAIEFSEKSGNELKKVKSNVEIAILTKDMELLHKQLEEVDKLDSNYEKVKVYFKYCLETNDEKYKQKLKELLPKLDQSEIKTTVEDYLK